MFVESRAMDMVMSERIRVRVVQKFGKVQSYVTCTRSSTMFDNSTKIMIPSNRKLHSYPSTFTTAKRGNNAFNFYENFQDQRLPYSMNIMVASILLTSSQFERTNHNDITCCEGSKENSNDSNNKNTICGTKDEGTNVNEKYSELEYDEEEERHCPFCKFFLDSPCKDPFIRWQKCVKVSKCCMVGCNKSVESSSFEFSRFIFACTHSSILLIIFLNNDKKQF